MHPTDGRLVVGRLQVLTKLSASVCETLETRRLLSGSGLSLAPALEYPVGAVSYTHLDVYKRQLQRVGHRHRRRYARRRHRLRPHHGKPRRFRLAGHQRRYRHHPLGCPSGKTCYPPLTSRESGVQYVSPFEKSKQVTSRAGVPPR